MQQQEYTEATRFLISVLHRCPRTAAAGALSGDHPADARPFLYLMQYSDSRTVTSWVELFFSITWPSGRLNPPRGFMSTLPRVMSRPAMVPLLGHGILGDSGLSIVKIKNILMGTCCAYLQDLPSTRTDLAAETLCFSYGRWGMHHSRSCFIGLGQTRVPPKLVGQCQKVWPPGSCMVSLKSE